MNEDLRTMAECLADAVCGIGIDHVVCGFCGKEFGEVVPEGCAPEKTVGTGELAGHIVAWPCRCDGFLRYARFLLVHRYHIAEALRAFAKRQAAASEQLTHALGSQT